MASHHFIGTGSISRALAAVAQEPTRLLEDVSDLVTASGLKVMAQEAVAFDGGGLTLVWVLAESHLVLHYWGAEGYATVDLHVCDYRQSNRHNARRLVKGLEQLCFTPGSQSWRRLRIEPPEA